VVVPEERHNCLQCRRWSVGTGYTVQLLLDELVTGKALLGQLHLQLVFDQLHRKHVEMFKHQQTDMVHYAVNNTLLDRQTDRHTDRHGTLWIILR